MKVGAATETEMKEKKARVEDALHATRAAVEEGIVPGGGVALHPLRGGALDKVAAENGEQKRRASRSSASAVAGSASQDQPRTPASTAPSPWPRWPRARRAASALNAATETYEDLVKAGVIDPAKVVRTALQNAASSVSALLLTTEAMIAEKPEPKGAGGGGMPDMGGMGGMPGMM